MTRHADPARLEARTQELGRELFQHARRERESLSALNRWAKQVLTWCLSDRQVKAQVLRFIDCLPSLTTPRAVVEHLHEYFPTRTLRLPAALRLGVSLAQPGLLTAPVVSTVVHRLAEQMASQFIAGANVRDATAVLRQAAGHGAMVSFDLLGEQVVSEPEAQRYADGYLDLVRVLGQMGDVPWPSGAVRCGALRHVSIKPSSLSARVDPLDPEGSLTRILGRLLTILEEAAAHDVAVTLDMEHFELRDLTLELAKRILLRPGLGSRVQLGVVIQAYLPDAEAVTDELLRWLASHKRTLSIRLVKGAYWDSEVAAARSRAWPVPVFVDKAQTDQAFERLTWQMLAAHPTARTAIGSHNVRSIAHAMAAAEEVGLAKDQVEYQVLYGMGTVLESAMGQMGVPVRVYTPLGELIPGMAYLVRRILENTANESFVRHDFVHDRSAEELLAPPVVTQTAVIAQASVAADAPAAAEIASGTGAEATTLHIEPPRDFSKAAYRDGLRAAVEQVRAQLGGRYPGQLGDRAIDGPEWVASRNPAQPEQIVGHVARATTRDVERAVTLARGAQPHWASVPTSERAAVLRRAAALMRRQRDELAAWEILEVGKTWREADADVVEAIEYIEYYSRRMEALARGRSLPQLPGERNQYEYMPRGVVAVIAPWNFPAAILTGMTTAALVTGNAVIVKPSEQSSVVAAQIIALLSDAGVPASVLQFLPGPGEEIGAALVQHPCVAAVLFTGSKAVGMSILKAIAVVAPGQRFVKHAVLELGGKNALIIDDDADLDAAVQGTVASAFGYQGQKCSAASRIIVHRRVYDRFVERLAAATDRLVAGDPAKPGTDLGPLIDASAKQRLVDAQARARTVGRVAYAYPESRLPAHGHFVGPMIVEDVPRDDALAREELFGPLVCVFRVASLEEAIALANDSDYGLTGGIYSRSPSHIRLVSQRLEAGNIYINRPITGALVGRQPFGGYKLSGLGTKAGGPDYLQQLLTPKTISENTARHGMPLE